MTGGLEDVSSTVAKDLRAKEDVWLGAGNLNFQHRAEWIDEEVKKDAVSENGHDLFKRLLFEVIIAWFFAGFSRSLLRLYESSDSLRNF